jgi:DNA polymerase (family 10)
LQNREIAALFREYSELLNLAGEDRFRVAAYRRASDTIRHEERPLAELAARRQLQSLSGIGPAISAEIDEILETGTWERLEELRTAMPRVLLELTRVPGLGMKTATALHANLQLPDLAGYEAAIRGGALKGFKGIGARREAEILSGLQARLSNAGRHLLGTGIHAAARLTQQFSARLPAVAMTPIGSIRRWSPTVGDVDFLAATDDPEVTLDAFGQLPDVHHVLHRDADRVRVQLIDGLQAECITRPVSHAGGALLWLTGNRSSQQAAGSTDVSTQAADTGFREALATYAAARGFTLDGTGLRQGDTYVDGDEAVAFAALGLPFIPPELREGGLALDHILRSGVPRLVELMDVRGDLHTHTEWSDGTGTVTEMIAAAAARGYQYYGIADHSQTLKIANGLTPERLHTQRTEIAAAANGIRVLQGCEIEVRSDGSLDLDDATLAALDFAVASVHSGQRGDRSVVTERTLRAMASRYVDIIAHPTGRLILHREPMDIDIDALIAGAIQTQTALEINGDYHRLDLDPPLARKAASAGVVISINSDAHSIDGLTSMLFGVQMARRAWLTPEQVLNCWPVEDILARRARRVSGQ